MKVALDIERLTQWCYREELAKRHTSSAEGLWDRMADWRFLGATVDLGNRGPQRYDHGLPHQDALRIERAVGALPDGEIAWEVEAPLVLGHLLALADPRMFHEKPANETRGTTAGWTNRAGHKVLVSLEPPRDVIMVRSLRTSALVTMHASAGTKPDWIAEIPRPQHVPAVRGPGPAIVGTCRGRNYYSTGSYCPLTWEPSPIEIMQARADYLCWWRGLVMLQQRLIGQLDNFTPLPPATSEMPWLMTGAVVRPHETLRRARR